MQIGLLADPVSIERIETIKGASAAMYGEAQPAGVNNVISKRPKTKLRITRLKSSTTARKS